jgi:hypothetical protein
MILKDNLTIIMPSRHPIKKKPHGWKVLNPVQIVKEHHEMHYMYCDSIASVNTKYFTIVDDDDPFPSFPETIEPTGIIFGDTHITYRGSYTQRKMPVWNLDLHLRNELLVHRAICSTEAAIEVLKEVRDLPLYTEHYLYLHLAYEYGWHYDPDYVAIWDKKTTGLHLLNGRVRNYTKRLLLEKYA